MSDKMSLREAIEILIRHACMNIQGAGCGIRQQPTREENMKGARAVERSWKYIYKEEMTEMEKYNCGISYYREISDGTK